MDVFIVLADENGVEEQIDLGMLHVERDDDGAIRRIEIEPYGWEFIENYALYFEVLDTECPEIPALSIITEHGARTAAFNSFFPEFYDIELPEDQEAVGREVEDYVGIVRAANRLYERWVRREPIMVGYRDIERHRQFFRQKTALTMVKLPPPRRAGPRPSVGTVATNYPSLTTRRSWQRVTLTPDKAAEPASWPTLTLDLCVLHNRFPARIKYFTGLVWTDDKETSGLVVREGGDIIIGSAGDKTYGPRYTDIMACRIAENASVLCWSVDCLCRQRYRVSRIETLIASLSPDDL